MKASTLTALRELDNEKLISALFLLAELHPEDFERTILSLSEEKQKTFYIPNGPSSAPGDYQTVRLSPDQLRNIRKEVNKISCIKLIREMTGLGLWESKCLCEKEFFPTI